MCPVDEISFEDMRNNTFLKDGFPTKKQNESIKSTNNLIRNHYTQSQK